MARKGSGTVDVGIDDRQLKELYDRLEPAQYEDALDQLKTDALIVGTRHAQSITPAPPGPAGYHRTGHARRSTRAVLQRHELEATYPYFNWLDKGEDTRGRKMLVEPGGYKIRQKTRDHIDEQLPELMERAADEMADAWAR